MQPTLTFEGLGVYLPEEILSQVEAIAAGRGVTAQELLEQTMFANRRCRNLELSPKARGILEHGEPWPSDPLEALQVGAILAFELAETSDNFAGRCRSDPQHYVMLNEIFPD
jgi:hypothetical protein